VEARCAISLTDCPSVTWHCAWDLWWQ